MARRDVERAARGKAAAGLALISLYLAAETRLGGLIRNLLSRPQAMREIRRVQADAHVELNRLRVQTPELARDLIESAFGNGQDEAGRMIGRPLSAIDTRATTILLDNLVESLEKAQTTVGRRVDDIFRREALRSVLLQVEAERPFEEARDQLVARLNREGITAFVDKAGRRWKLSTYASMAIRTTQAEALAEGTIQKMREHGLDLVTMSEHACDHHPSDPTHPCRRLEGQTLSISGRTEGYERLPKMPLHPNCGHFVLPAVEAFDLPRLVAA